MPNPLERELQTYQEQLPNLLVQEGKFVLIADGEVIDTYETYADALKVGYEKKRLHPFLVKQIKSIEPIYSFSRPLLPCLT
jgi:hypothetical protein